MDEDEGYDLDFLNEYWESMLMINDREVRPLTDFLKECLGERNGGLFFLGCGKEDGNGLVLKLDSAGHLYKRISDTGDDEKDWEWLGDIVDEDTRPII